MKTKNGQLDALSAPGRKAVFYQVTNRIMLVKSFMAMALACLLGSGCATSSYMRAAQTVPAVPPRDSARVVFMRASNFGGAIKGAVFDVTGDDLKLVGILSPMEKVVYDVKPGKKVFMVVAENADFMEANLVAGRIYHAIVTPRYGWWKARFSLHPFKQNAAEPEFQVGSDAFRKWDAACSYIELAPNAEDWVRANRPSLLSKKAAYGEKWADMLEKDKQWRRLEPEDGQ